VKVGSVEHPMVDAHYIEWIEIHTDKKVYRKYLTAGHARKGSLTSIIALPLSSLRGKLRMHIYEEVV